MAILYVIIYLLGCVSSYFSNRLHWELSGFQWTVGDRANAIFLSLFSWMAVLSIWIVFLVDLSGSKKPAKW